MTALLVIGILVFLIVIHELGHFVAAKIFRVRVEEFGVGYPPRAFRFGKIGDTEYTLNWIPFGGFVRLFGDIGEEEHGAGSFVDARRVIQALILIAGVAANALAAWALFTAALHAGIPRPVAAPVPGEEARLIVYTVISGSPADAAGIESGDEIRFVSDARGERVSELTPVAVSEFVAAHGGEALAVTYSRARETATAEVTPAHAVIAESADRPALGVALVLVSAESLPWSAAAREAIAVTQGSFVTVARKLWDILAQAFSGAPDLSGVMGPVGLVGVVNEAAQAGLGRVLALAAFISVNLAIINLVPIPALDGGRLALLGVEVIMSRKAPRLLLQALNVLGVTLIIFLMVAITFNDVSKLLT